MAKLTLEDLRKMRGEKQKAMEMRDSSNKDVQVIVGMGTCGIAAGAKGQIGFFISPKSGKGAFVLDLGESGDYDVSGTLYWH